MKQDESPASGAPEAGSPFPPAFRWEVSSPEETTQVMGVIGRDDVAGATRVAPPGVSGASGHFQAPRPSQVPDLFQPIGKPVDTHPDGAFTTLRDTSAPPWADSDLPPIAEQPIAEQPIAEQQTAAIRRGTEVFRTPARKQILGIAVLAIIVLGLVGATVAYFVTTASPDRTTSAAAQPTESPPDLPATPATLPPPVDTEQALIEPPGRTRGGGGLFDLPQLERTNLLPRPMVKALQAGRMIDGVLKTTTAGGGTTIGMFALTMPDRQAATTVVRSIVAVQYEGGLLADNSRALQGVAVLGSAPGPPSTVYRVAYVLYNRAIYFEVFGPDRNSVLKTVDFLINQQVSHAPPTVRGG
ncbi:MAG: hypothetical protein ACRDSR_04960 [Pseudonocardiaceae bacterium]